MARDHRGTGTTTDLPGGTQADVLVPGADRGRPFQENEGRLEGPERRSRRSLGGVRMSHLFRTDSHQGRGRAAPRADQQGAHSSPPCMSEQVLDRSPTSGPGDVVPVPVVTTSPSLYSLSLHSLASLADHGLTHWETTRVDRARPAVNAPPAVLSAERLPGMTRGRQMDQQAPTKRGLMVSPDFDVPERLLIKPIRLWLHGVETWPLVGMCFKATFGPGASAIALQSLKDVIETLNNGGRRIMSFRPVHCARVTADERALVALMAALQARDLTCATAIAEWLVTQKWQSVLLQDAMGLADCFSHRNFTFLHSPRNCKNN